MPAAASDFASDPVIAPRSTCPSGSRTSEFRSVRPEPGMSNAAATGAAVSVTVPARVQPSLSKVIKVCVASCAVAERVTGPPR